MLTNVHQTIESVVSLRAPFIPAERKRKRTSWRMERIIKDRYFPVNPVSKPTIQEMARKALESGTGTSATGTIPVLLKKRQDLEKSGGKEGIKLSPDSRNGSDNLLRNANPANRLSR